MKKSIGRVVAVALAIVIAAGMSVPALADSEPVQVQTARQFMEQFGVDQGVQDALVSKYLQGETWDSMTPGMVPTKTSEFERADGSYTLFEYEDGSIAVTRIEKAIEGNPRQRGISGCSVSGAQYTGCKIDTWVGLVMLSFYTSYNLSTNRVTSAPWGAGYTIGGACSAYVSYLGRPALNIAQMNVQAQMCGVGYTTWFELRLTISGGRAVVSWT